ncbi:MAG: Uncharacterized protein FD161_4556 [Limisphaerales bacterium]|nr:MAG: Uncharacterized protein FD161_4556 [Limisphaerales bacterium]KAG0506817.1 MAG: Uncharacterized protein E1N63_4024 [Limisphaerales bacterium]TXT45522.1 MAG: Uncharacterized protein FD140_4696 [Limisphaerales bacterium]
MRTVLHIFLKDVRQMRWTLALWLALLAVQLWSCLSESQKTMADWDYWFSTAPKLPVWTVLHWLGLVVLTFEVILADRPCGAEPSWRTRPIDRWQMATAKLLFLAVFAVLLPGALEFIAFTGQGVSADESARGLLLALFAQIYVLSWMVLLAVMARRRTWEVLCLAPLSAAMPFLLIGCSHGLVRGLEEWDWAELAGLNGRYWHQPPDFNEPEWSLLFGLIWFSPPVVVAGLAVAVAYLRGSRPVVRGIMAGMMVALVLAPLVLLLQEVTHPSRAPVASTRTNTAAELNWRPEWNAKWRSALNLKLDVPTFPARPGSTDLHLPSRGWPTMRGRMADSQRWRTLWSSAFPDELRFSQFDAHERHLLTRTNGPLGALLRVPFRVLNPPTEGAPEVTGTGSWHDSIPLTRFGELSLSLRFLVEESSVVVVRREPFRGWAAVQPESDSGNAEEPTAPERNVIVLTPHLDLPVWQDRSAAALAPRHALLWHPERREVILPTQTELGYKRAPDGVLAFADMFRVRTHRHRSIFPKLDKLLSGSGISEREWLAGAEMVLLAYRPVATRHHVIHVPDVPLPPVPPPTTKP